MIENQRYVLVKGRSGLGNRLLSTLTALLYARLSGRRLLVDWSDEVYAAGGVNVFPRLFQCTLCDANAVISQTDSVAPSLWRDHLTESSVAVHRRAAAAYSEDAFVTRWREMLDLVLPRSSAAGSVLPRPEQ